MKFRVPPKLVGISRSNFNVKESLECEHLSFVAQRSTMVMVAFEVLLLMLSFILLQTGALCYKYQTPENVDFKIHRRSSSIDGPSWQISGEECRDRFVV